MKTILVATDFSAEAFNAALYALELAKVFESKIFLLNVYRIPNPMRTLPVEIIRTAEELEKNVETHLTQLKSNLLDIKPCKISIECTARPGLTEIEISSFADIISADLIVMGMRGGGLKEKLIGSVSTSILNKTERPVLLIPKQAIFRNPENIVLADDGNNDLIPDINALSQIANKFHSKIHMLNIYPPREIIDKDEMADNMELHFNKFNHEFHFLESDHVDETINQFIESGKAHLLVMIPKKHTFFSKLFAGSHTRRLAFHTTVPMLTLHAKEQS